MGNTIYTTDLEISDEAKRSLLRAQIESYDQLMRVDEITLAKNLLCQNKPVSQKILDEILSFIKTNRGNQNNRNTKSDKEEITCKSSNHLFQSFLERKVL